MLLNLDTDFTPYGKVGSISFEAFTFSGGEPHIKILTEIPPDETVIITHRIRSFNDLGLLALAVDALRRLSIKHIEAFIPYFPGARQDRVMMPGEPLSVKIYADLINSMNFDKLTIFDPHSEVTPALLKNCSVLSNHRFIKDVVKYIDTPNLLLIAPDGGALKKIYKVAKALDGMEVVECGKTRDVQTGKLTGFKVYDDDLEGRPCLIVDDICDGGGTFIGLAEELRTHHAGDLYLAASHGIFSKGVKQLNVKFRKIFTTDAFNEVVDTNTVQMRLENIIEK